MTQPIPPTPEGIPGSSNGAAKSPDAGDRKGIEERVGQAASQVPKPESAGRLALRIVSGIAVPNPKELKEKLKTMTFGALVRELQELRARGDLGFGVVAKMTGGRPAYEDMVQMYVDRINLLYSPIAVALGLSASPAPTETQVHQLLDRIEGIDPAGVTKLMKAARSGDLGAVSQLLEYGADVHAQSSAGHTVLMYAIRGQSDSVLKALLNAGAQIGVPGPDGRTAIHHALKYGSAAQVQRLLDAGADVNRLSTGSMPQTPLGEAITEDKHTIFLMLLPKASQATKDDALPIAAALGRVTMVEELLNNEANPNAKTRHAPVVAAAAEVSLIPVNARLEVMRLLLAAGADPRLGRQMDNLTALQILQPWADLKNQEARDLLEVIELLTEAEHRAQADQKIVEQSQAAGATMASPTASGESRPADTGNFKKGEGDSRPDG
jgi:ankyrin repeat protein